MRNVIAVLAGIAVLAVVGVTIAARSRPGAGGETPARPAAPRTVREPAVAGPAGFGFYDSDPEILGSDVRARLERAAEPQLPGRLVALISPHAGYRFSGDVMAHAYKCLEKRRFDTVVIVGPSHTAWFQGAALTEADAWRTPLGTVPIDTDLSDKLRKASGTFVVDRRVHEREHSVEVQVPFLQVALGDFKLVPIVVWDRSEAVCATIAQTLAKVLAGTNVLLIASTDMSHYPRYEDANTVDKAMLKVIERFDVSKVLAADRELMGTGVRNLECTLCGLAPVVIVMDAAKRLGADSVTVLKYANSGDADPSMLDRCVGYGAVALCAGQGPGTRQPAAEQDSKPAEQTSPGGQLTPAQRKEVLGAARRTLEVYLTEGKTPAVETQDAALKRPAAVFVTLKKQGLLRGCIGCFAPDAPLVEQVQKMAIQAATRDPRFRPVRAEELKDIEISIQVLSPIRPVNSPDEIRVGEHGVVVRQGMRQGVYLPDVATEMGWTREQMLNSLCAEKAGLAPDAWQHGAKLSVFTTERFSEREIGLLTGSATQ
jgi:hypothetical protein